MIPPEDLARYFPEHAGAAWLAAEVRVRGHDPRRSSRREHYYRGARSGVASARRADWCWWRPFRSRGARPVLAAEGWHAEVAREDPALRAAEDRMDLPVVLARLTADQHDLVIWLLGGGTQRAWADSRGVHFSWASHLKRQALAALGRAT